MNDEKCRNILMEDEGWTVREGDNIQVTEEDMKEYVNQSLYEILIRDKENELLHILKVRQTLSPSKRNDKDWLDFSNFVCERRRYNEMDQNRQD